MAELPASRGRTGPVMAPGQQVDGATEVASALIGVYRTQEEASAVVRSVREAGTPSDRIRTAHEDDFYASLPAEMNQETSDALLVPTAGFAHTKEATKGAIALGIPIVVVCALVALPFGFIHISGVPLWIRLLVSVGLGAVVGGTIAVIVGPAMASKRSGEPSAAQRGVVVRVDDADGAAESILVNSNPIRVDRVANGTPLPLENLVTEEQFTPGGIFEEIERNAE